MEKNREKALVGKRARVEMTGDKYRGVKYRGIKNGGERPGGDKSLGLKRQKYKH